MRNGKRMMSMLLMFTLVLSLILPSTTPYVAAAGTVKPPITLLPTDDAFISAVQKDTNYNANWLQLKGLPNNERKIYMKYDLSNLIGVKLNSIGKVEAQLKKSSTNGTVMAVEVREVIHTDWSQSTITWNNAPAHGTQAYAQQTVSQQPGIIYNFDITGLVKAKLAAGANVLSIAYVATSTLNENMEFAANAGDNKMIITFVDPVTGPIHEAAQLGSNNTGNIRVVEFNATPSSSTGNGTVGLTSNGTVPASLNDFPLSVRFGADGSITAVNGNMFGAVSTFPFSSNQTYHFKAVVHLPLQKYDLWVTGPGAVAPVLLASDYRLATNAPRLSDIGKIYTTADANASDMPQITAARIIQSKFTSTVSFSDASVLLESDNKLDNRSYSVKFDLLVTGDPANTDALVALADSGTAVNGFADLAYIVRTYLGTFDARNDGVYAKFNTLNSESNVTYHVEMVIKPDATTGAATKTYDVWVAREGGTPVQIASNYKIRNYSNSSYILDDLGKIRVYSAADGAILVDNLTVLDGNRLQQAVNAVNAAGTANEMVTALERVVLDLPMERYAVMDSMKRTMVAQDVLSARPAGGYTGQLGIQSVFLPSVANRLDTQNPTPPGNVNVVISNTLQAKVNWSPSQDDTEILFYKVFRNGVEAGTVHDGTSFADLDLEPDTSYTYIVKAYDLVMKEAASAAVTVVSPSPSQLAYFPFSKEAITGAFQQGLLKYKLEPYSSMSWVMEWRMEYENSANALKLLTLAASYAPDYVGPDGVTTVTDRALQHIRSVIAGGNEPGFAGNGLSGQGYMPVLDAMTIAKLKAPSVWNALSTEEKSKIDLFMMAGFYGAKFCYDDENDNKTGIDATGNFDKAWNPNHRAGVVGAINAMYYFQDDVMLNNAMRTFNYDNWIAQLTAAGLTNIRTIYQNSGKTLLEQEIRRDAQNNGFTYQGHLLNQPGKIMQAFVNYTFQHPVSPVGAYDSNINEYRGSMVGGQDDLPNLGADSMGFEFRTYDANGVRSSLTYVFMGWKPNIDALLPVLLFNEVPSGLTQTELNNIMLRFNIGTTDMLYKNIHGYLNFAKGKSEGVATLDGPVLTMNLDIWNNILNNPLAEVAVVNGAGTAEAMRTALESPSLNMVLYGYSALTEAAKTAVAHHVLVQRPAAGYANKSDAQEQVYEGVRVQALLALSQATAGPEILNALKSSAMGIYMPKLDAATDTKKQEVAQFLLANKPADGFTSKTLVRQLVETALTPQGNQLKNLPAVAQGEKRIDIHAFNQWPQQHGDASVALWEDDKAGAFSLTIDDNFEHEHDKWLAISNEYGFKFTWFVITNNIISNAKWATLLANGHDVQSHTVHHLDNGDTLPVSQIQSEYSVAITRLNQITGANVKTIGYPYGKANINVASDYHIAGRGTVGLSNQADTVHYMNTNALSIRPASLKYQNVNASDNSVEAMVKTLYDPNYKVWNVSYLRGWSNMYVHNLSEKGVNPTTGTEKTSEDLVRYLLQTLKDNKDKVWVAPFTTVAMYGQERDTSSLIVTKKDQNEIAFHLTDRMDDTLFQYPLTVKVKVDSTWTGIQVVQNGISSPFTEVIQNGSRYLLVKAVPDKGTVSITHAAP